MQPVFQNIHSFPFSIFVQDVEQNINNERFFGFPEDPNLKKLKGMWRSRFYETHTSRLGTFLLKCGQLFLI